MRPSESDVRVVFCTAPDGEVAERLARALLEARLAACVNLLSPVRSLYRWQGAVKDDSEVLLVIKTHRDRCAELSARIEELHPYELPEVVALPAVGGSTAYLEWVLGECCE